ncbi:NRAMP family divalent metal transporter [Haliea atlantica]
MSDQPKTLRQRFGPGLLVTAAFIGPGTITTASSAGAHYGFALLWALLFSVLATFVLQEMSARLGLVTRRGLAEAMRAHFSNPVFGRLAILLVVIAVGLGNAAYESGNIAGAAMALTAVGAGHPAAWSILIGLIAGGLLASGRYQALERTLVVLVLLMAAVFTLTAVLVAPPLGAMLEGVLRPEIPPGATLVVVALIGTTVVPYNLFLHASAVTRKWPESLPVGQALRESRLDSALSIGIGGVVTLAVMSTAAATFFGSGEAFAAGTLARQLEPLLGPAAPWVFACGLFAAGLTSAITAPLAAAWAVCGALGWRTSLDAPGFRLVWLLVLLTGTLLAATGTRPVQAILFAQAANGLLLPVVALFLLLVMNSRALLGGHRNRWLANGFGGLVVLVATALGGLRLIEAAGRLAG